MKNVDNQNILPLARVMAFDPSLFRDDVSTPLSATVKPATVVCRYGYRSKWMDDMYGKDVGLYPDLVDLSFDHRPSRISHGHFTSGVTFIGEGA